MALVAGSCTVDAGGNVTGSGLALARYAAQKILFDANMAGCPLATAQVVAMLQQMAAAATSSAAADIGYLTAHAAIATVVSVGGLQNTTTNGVATNAPTAPQTLAGTLS